MFLGGALEGLAGGMMGGLGALGAQGASRDMAREQMQFQERMSSTAYQRATHDMQQAGINPMLAYMKGGADSAPGAMGQAENAGSAFSAGRQAAMQSRMAEASAKQAEYAADKIEAETEGQEIDNKLKPEYLKIQKANMASSALTAEKYGTNSIYNSLKQAGKDIGGILGIDSSGLKSKINNANKAEPQPGSMYMRQK